MSTALATIVESRSLQPEVMDQPGLDEGLHRAALAGLRRINWWSRTDAALWRRLRAAADVAQRPLRVLDVACGGGDVLTSLALRARRAGMSMQWSGCDMSSLALEFARQHGRKLGVTGIDYFEYDVIRDGVPADYDVILCTLFLHHLTADDAEALMRRMAAASKLVLIDDLVRTRMGYLLAWGGARILTRSPVVHFDGPQSVRAAFTRSELQSLSQRAGLAGATIERHWPQRMLLSWERS